MTYIKKRDDILQSFQSHDDQEPAGVLTILFARSHYQWCNKIETLVYIIIVHLLESNGEIHKKTK